MKKGKKKWLIVGIAAAAAAIGAAAESGLIPHELGALVQVVAEVLVPTPGPASFVS